MKTLKIMALALALLNTACLTEQNAQKSAAYSNVGLDGVNVKLASGGATAVYKPEFIVLSSAKNPEKKLRRGDFGYKMLPGEQEGLLYTIPTWGKAEGVIDSSKMHVEDGFNPETDRGFGKDRTANYYKAAKTKTIVAQSAKLEGDKVIWTFPEDADFILTATLTIPKDASTLARVDFEFTPKKAAWYSVGYIGAPETEVAEIEEIWQATIWQEKRFPNAPYLCEAYRCTIPGTLVQAKGVTTGMLADLKFLPFEPMPKDFNSQFGVMLVSPNGKAQSSIFAPVLGNDDSNMKSGVPFNFTFYIYQKQKPLLDAYEDIARNFCNFSDIRRNSTCSLNTTIENLTEFCLGEYGGFLKELKGCNYSTDVPGSVKNISGLHPLSTSLLTDNESIFKEVARPMLEYGISRERFLFSTDENIKGQGTVARLNGPGVPMSDLSATYTYSRNRIDYMLLDAKKLYDNKVVRSINLSSQNFEDRWQNAAFLYAATKDKNYLEQAKTGADEYLKTRVYTKQTDFQDKLSIGLFFWTSFTNQWMELYDFYKMTGDKKYLEAARDGARHYTEFCWMVPSIPEGKILVNKGGEVPRYRNGNKFKPMKLPETEIEAWKVSEIGLTPESSGTSGGHRAIFMAHHAPFMMRIAADTGDKFLHDVARNAVVGRYESFPGYHINAGRTNAFEKKNFCEQPQETLNAHTSIHYNHPWSHLAMLWDYLFSDVYYRSAKAIDFPVEYSEGYAYCRSFVYGAHAGKFYSDTNVWAYMPKDLLDVSNVQINYLAAYGNGNLYVAFTNQSKEAQKFDVSFNAMKSYVQKNKIYSARLWKGNVPMGQVQVKDGKISLDVAPEGITAIAISGVDVKTVFQSKFYSSTQKWKTNYTSVGLEKDRAVLFDFGKDLLSVYAWHEGSGKKYAETTLHYSIDGGEWDAQTKKAFPFEFTVELPANASKFEYYFEYKLLDGAAQKTKTGILQK